MNKFEQQAVNVFLANYDETMSYNAILEALENEEYDSIEVWQPFEEHLGNEIAANIDSLHRSLLDNFS